MALYLHIFDSLNKFLVFTLIYSNFDGIISLINIIKPMILLKKLREFNLIPKKR